MATAPRRRTKAEEEKLALLKQIREDVEKAYSLSRDRAVNNILSRVIDNFKSLDAANQR